MKTALFIVHDLYQDDNHFPLGIGYLAAVLKQNHWKVTIYNQDVYHFTNEHLAHHLDNSSYDFIGLGFLSARFTETVLPLSQVISEHKGKAMFAIGGHGASSLPDYMLSKCNADDVYLGEAEESILGGALYPKDLDKLPIPAWELFPIAEYSRLRLPRWGIGDKSLAIISSRGCINACSFCYRVHPGVRLRSMDSVVDEIRLLRSLYGINYFHFQDEMFVITKKRLIDFSDLLHKHNLKIKYLCDARIDIFDREVAEILKESGCRFVNFGFESTSQKVLDLMHKNQTVEQNHVVADICKQSGMGMGINILWGCPGDTEYSLKSNVAFIKKYNTYDQPRTIRPVTPYPGSELYHKHIGDPDLFYNNFKNSDLLTLNFTGIPTTDFYKMLFEANRELILDHYEHTTIKSFNDLYFRGDIKFRGARHYNSASA